MKDSTIDYAKILEALNNSINLMDITSDAKEQLYTAQQNVQQAMTYSLSKDKLV